MGKPNMGERETFPMSQARKDFWQHQRDNHKSYEDWVKEQQNK